MRGTPRDRRADYLLENEFESMRMAHLFGEWVEDEHGKCGVQVDVIYEPPQQVGISVEYRRGGRMA